MRRCGIPAACSAGVHPRWRKVVDVDALPRLIREHDPSAVLEPLKRADRATAQRHAPARALRLRVALQAPLRERPLHGEDPAPQLDLRPVRAERLSGRTPVPTRNSTRTP